MSWDVVVVGAGAAGLLAAARAAERGRRTLLVEKNRRPGIKILMSGGTRCNLTQQTDRRGIVQAFGPQGTFLHSALAVLGPAELVALIEAEGVPTKVEETGKVFPVSDRAEDVLDALLRRLERSGCQLALGEPVLDVCPTVDGFQLATAHRTLSAANVIVTTGGRSYPGCGTTGDGYRWLADLGHTIVTPRPALTPLTTAAGWVTDLRGVTVTDVAVRVVADHPAEAAGGPGGRGLISGGLAQRRGSLLFTHFGLSGPAALDVSRVVSGDAAPRRLRLECDFLPDLSEPQLDAQLRQQAASGGRKQVGGVVARWLPRRLVDALLTQLGMSDELRMAEMSRRDRQRLTTALKQTVIPLTGTRGFKKAEVTAGGVALDEVDSRTCRSKLVPSLFLAGEILDLDGPIGGYNFQAAFSTGWLAGSHA